MIERLKDIAHDIGAERLQASFRKQEQRDGWLVLQVKHASILADAPDGWEAEIMEIDL